MVTKVTLTTPAIIPIGSITRACARQLNYQVLLFHGNVSNVHENVMLPIFDTLMLLTVEGPSMDKKDEHWSIIKHEEEGACEENKIGVCSGDVTTPFRPYTNHTRKYVRSRSGTHGKISQHNSRHKLK